ncbi:MAG: hypothetical protein ABWW65_06715 [Thermoprotei archaeon]
MDSAGIDNELAYIRRKLKKIMLFASHGFYRTVDNGEKVNNRFFLEIIKEAYKALNTIYRISQKIGVEENARSK